MTDSKRFDDKGISKVTKDRLTWIISGLDFNDLSPWEEKFMESCESYFEYHGDLTDKQEEIIEQIYKEKGR